jgi:hypothetical protein
MHSLYTCIESSLKAGIYLIVVPFHFVASEYIVMIIVVIYPHPELQEDRPIKAIEGGIREAVAPKNKTNAPPSRQA